MRRGIVPAILAAILFGISIPLAKLLAGNASPFLLAGALYLGSGVGLFLMRIIRDGGWRPSGLSGGQWPWMLGAVGFGGLIAPVLMMIGLNHTTAATASLLLNLESVLTAAIAWFIFRENADHRIVLGMLAIVAGGLILSWPQAPGATSEMGQFGHWKGPLAIGLACLCWAIDNNLTRNVSSSDAVFIAAFKGAVAGLINCAIAWQLGASLPSVSWQIAAAGLGFVGYGLSLVMFVLALRELGTARTGAYFAMAPFIGAGVALFWLGEPAPGGFWIAAALMGLGVWLHLTEQHEHEHQHEMLEHSHTHEHDEHHRHTHAFPCKRNTAHSHPHQHTALVHSHRHMPDLHHRHDHKAGG